VLVGLANFYPSVAINTHLKLPSFGGSTPELGWGDFRLTDAAPTPRWRELVMCAYLLVSL
jgi:hypothetical protein